MEGPPPLLCLFQTRSIVKKKKKTTTKILWLAQTRLNHFFNEDRDFVYEESVELHELVVDSRVLLLYDLLE